MRDPFFVAIAGIALIAIFVFLLATPNEAMLITLMALAVCIVLLGLWKATRGPGDEG
ncbi:MAG: hypothetical protein NWR80_06070 [Burkholderiaceae bacterium]|jgi:hypothetical protein|nr:hypothetical protein [Burkholderiaceae bacterium]